MAKKDSSLILKLNLPNIQTVPVQPKWDKKEVNQAEDKDPSPQINDFMLQSKAKENYDDCAATDNTVTGKFALLIYQVLSGHRGASESLGRLLLEGPERNMRASGLRCAGQNC
ncbi:hypothetical protein AAFF_G00139820 [Aldrovandia affinis]|uniref:Uncharacterized protein n=1 Tax=Aldrovandia affinis TaxID=143900 RepID=A0AAD7X2Y2_9TELE|nr:hypothetical protein AAFF_G00139820 [Aldrovandia affinis]